MNDILSKTALEQAQAIKDKRISVEELVREYVDRIEKYDGKDGLNSVCEMNGRALEQARGMDSDGVRDGMMFGLPVLVKDNVDVAGLHTTAGSLALADNMAVRDAAVVANLKRNGAIILGKTNLTEFANYTGKGMPNGYSSRGGQVKNAYDREKDPGGSSTGSAVAVSAGFCAAAVGTDTSFSIVGCATENGVAGYKPPAGTLSPAGIVPIAQTLDSAGPLARSLSDALLVYSCMRDTPIGEIKPSGPSGIRIAVNIYNQDQVSKSQLAEYDRVLNCLMSDGGFMEEVVHAHTPYQKDVMRCEFQYYLNEYLAGSTASRRTLREIIDFYESKPAKMMKYGISYLKGALSETAGSLNDELYLEALDERKKLRHELLESIRGYDACIMTGPTNIMHFIGLPSVAICLGMNDNGVPRGMVLYGADERRLLSAALTLERYCEPVTMPLL